MTATAELSLFARSHRVHARFLIAFTTAGILLTGSALGNLWTTDGLRMGPGVLAVLFAVYLIVFPLYPVLRRHTNWLRRKAFDTVLVACTVLLGIWLGVQGDRVNLLTETQDAHAAGVQPAPTKNASSTTAHRFAQKVHRGTSILKLIFRRPVRFGEPALFDTGAKIALTLLAVALLAALGYLVIAVSCSLSCSGNALGGTLVLTLGGAAVLGVFVLAIIRIYRGERWVERRAHRRSMRG